jgi:hypothetical protein
MMEVQMTCYAYAWASGLIEFGDAVPGGALRIMAFASEPAAREFIEPKARHSYEPGVLLVPGVPEALDGKHALAALALFRDWISGTASPANLKARGRAWNERLYGKIAEAA